MLIVFADHPDLGEIAHARYGERKRIISIASLLASKFPEQYRSSKKKYKIAVQLCNKFSEEVNNKFNLI